MADNEKTKVFQLEDDDSSFVVTTYDPDVQETVSYHLDGNDKLLELIAMAQDPDFARVHGKVIFQFMRKKYEPHKIPKKRKNFADITQALLHPKHEVPSVRVKAYPEDGPLKNRFQFHIDANDPGQKVRSKQREINLGGDESVRFFVDFIVQTGLNLRPEAIMAILEILPESENPYPMSFLDMGMQFNGEE